MISREEKVNREIALVGKSVFRKQLKNYRIAHENVGSEYLDKVPSTIFSKEGSKNGTKN